MRISDWSSDVCSSDLPARTIIAAAPLKVATGAPIIGCAPLALADDGPRADSAFDPDYAPDRILTDGERISGDGWTLEAVATPGQTSNPLCFGLIESGSLFTGDHVLALSTQKGRASVRAKVFE